ncbi:unnamed protein product, partial [Leptidea sinapis]
MFTINKVVLITYYLIFVLSSYNLQAQKNHSKKLSECRRCKIYSDSFNNWFEKTSRGKFEGGDAAWEEAKLKSYSRSEVRLVEIQENLCSELNHYKDECYSLAEEVEAFPCHKSCDKCYGEGNKNCIDCALGWKLEDGMCTDINECSLNNIVCSSDQFCINNEGSFYCKPCDRTCDKCSGYGPHACTECKPGHQLWS